MSLIETEVEGRNRRIVDAIQAGRLADAAAQLDISVRDRPQHAADQYLLASVLAGLGRTGEALTWFRRVTTLMPGHDKAHFLLGLTLLAEGDARGAETPLRKSLDLRPERTGAVAALGTSLNRQERWGEAEPFLALASASRGTDSRLQYEWGLALFRLKRFDEAAIHLNEVIGLDPNWPPPRMIYARVMHKAGELQEAAIQIERAAALDPASSDARRIWGQIDFDRHLLEQSCRHFWRAIALRPAAGESHFFLGRALHDLQRNSEALAAFSCAIALRPDWSQAHLAQGIAWLEGDRVSEGAASISRAVALRPEWPLPRHHLANALLDLGRDAAAITERAACACLNPHDYGRHLTLAPLAHGKTGDISGLDAYASSRGLQKLVLPPADHGESGGYSCFAVALSHATVMGHKPLIITMDGTLLVEGVGYNPAYARGQLYTFDQGWLAGSRGRYVLAGEAGPLYSGEHLFLGAYQNVGHWLMNNLSRLIYAQRHPALSHLPVVVPDSISNRQREWLMLAGYGADRVTAIPANSPVTFEKLWVAATLHQWPRVQDRHGAAAGAARFLAGLGQRVDPEARSTKGRRLYFTRGNTTRRRPVNESEVIASLRTIGFEALDPAMLSAREQVCLVRSADIIVSPMGAAAIVIAMGRPGTHLIELRVPGAPFDLFPYLCATNGQTYEAVMCQRTHVNKKLLFDDLVVPIPDLMSTLHKRITDL